MSSHLVIGSKLIEPLCYVSMIALSVIASIDEKLVPLHVNITVFSLAIITVGSYRSLAQMLAEIKKGHLDEKPADGQQQQTIETVTTKDALQFPLYAGGMLLGLYCIIKFFGKDAVNYLLLVYIAIGGATGMKALLQSLTGNALQSVEDIRVFSFKFKDWIDLQVSALDLVGLVMSVTSVAFYVWSKSWIYNNILAVVFCVHALQFIFLGNFKTGALLLTLLFFYDIFFVFGTDVMITVAKNVDAPIKLQVPRDLTTSPPQYSILGLGDIVIPGIFMSLCLRFDVLKALSLNKLEALIDGERKGKGEDGQTIEYIVTEGNKAPKHYYMAVVVGYLIAIITTVVIMFVFNHGQPALLYLVPGCIMAVAVTALVKGEMVLVLEFVEEKFYGAVAEEEGAKKDK